jgi:hypothetical protein
LRGPVESASRSPVAERECLQRKCGANTVDFGQDDNVVIIWLSHKELTVERNVYVGEELLQRRVAFQE